MLKSYFQKIANCFELVYQSKTTDAIIINSEYIYAFRYSCDIVIKIPFFLDWTVALDYFLDLQDHKVVCNNLRILLFDLLLS